jgi:predicted MPP superfamily phosphohydrolase
MPAPNSLVRVIVYAAAASLWLLSINRVLIQMEDGGLKTLCVAASAIGCIALARLAARRPERIWGWCALSVLSSCAVGEGHRAWLRSKYGHVTPTPEAWVVPVTTTDLRTTYFEIPPRAPSRPPLRVAHLTDLHISDRLPAEYFASLHESIRQSEADLLVMTGDYVSAAERLPLLRHWLAELPDLPLGTYAVLGNHDYWTGEASAVRDALEQASVQVLSGRCVELDVADLRICGTDAPWGPDLSGWTQDDLTTLALSHTPDNVYALRELGADVVFAGHTHGGQIRLPGLGALVVPSRFGRRFDRGDFDVEGTHLIVSAGVGADSPPLRLWCRPELVVVDLNGSRG